MAKPTYEDLQDLKAEVIASIAAFQLRFPTAKPKIALQCDIPTAHGSETIKISIKDIPAYAQGTLPDMNSDDDGPTPIRRNGTARTFPMDG